MKTRQFILAAAVVFLAFAASENVLAATRPHHSAAMHHAAHTGKHKVIKKAQRKPAVHHKHLVKH